MTEMTPTTSTYFVRMICREFVFLRTPLPVCLLNFNLSVPQKRRRTNCRYTMKVKIDKQKYKSGQTDGVLQPISLGWYKRGK